jgi:ubiquinone/menaquinone biosynthesis C-methylase UbiE
MKFTGQIGAQFRNPTGIGGAVSTFLMNTMNRRQYAATERALSLSGGERVLDVGFGNGYLLSQLAKKYDCVWAGIDVSSDMVEAASKRVPSANLTVGDIVKTNFADGYFDKIYTVNTVYFWSDLSACLCEIHRILKNGGVFVNTVYSREWLEKMPFTRLGFAKYNLDEFTQAGEKCGFTVQAKPITNKKSYYLIYRKGEKLCQDQQPNKN